MNISNSTPQLGKKPGRTLAMVLQKSLFTGHRHANQ